LPLTIFIQLFSKFCDVIIVIKQEDNTAVTVEGTKVKLVENFCYMGSNISRLGNCNKDNEMESE